MSITPAVERQFSLLFSTFPSRTENLREAIEAYGVSIEGAEYQDVENAVRRFLQGAVEGHNPSWAPSAPMLGKVVREEAMRRLESEERTQRYTRPQLGPPRVHLSKAERHRMAELADETVAKLDPKRKGATSDPAFWSSTHKMFEPDMSPSALKRRLGLIGERNERLATD